MELRSLYFKDPQTMLRQSHIWELLARRFEHHTGGRTAHLTTSSVVLELQHSYHLEVSKEYRISASSQTCLICICIVKRFPDDPMLLKVSEAWHDL